MKFVFAFEKLLQHKRNVEDATRRDMNIAAAKLEAVEKELKAMYQAIDDSRVRALDYAHGRTPAGGGTSGNLPQSKSNSTSAMLASPLTALVQIDEFIRGQGVRIDQQKKKVREHKAIVEEVQELLLEAAKERKIYEKLREQKLAEFKDAEKKRDLKRVDDMVSTRFARLAGDADSAKK